MSRLRAVLLELAPLTVAHDAAEPLPSVTYASARKSFFFASRGIHLRLFAATACTQFATTREDEKSQDLHTCGRGELAGPVIPPFRALFILLHPPQPQRLECFKNFTPFFSRSLRLFTSCFNIPLPPPSLGTVNTGKYLLRINVVPKFFYTIFFFLRSVFFFNPSYLLLFKTIVINLQKRASKVSFWKIFNDLVACCSSIMQS